MAEMPYVPEHSANPTDESVTDLENLRLRRCGFMDRVTPKNKKAK
jgi:hypothetical protein